MSQNTGNPHEISPDFDSSFDACMDALPQGVCVMVFTDSQSMTNCVQIYKGMRSGYAARDDLHEAFADATRMFLATPKEREDEQPGQRTTEY